MLAVVVLALYIKVWFTKIDDKYYVKSGEDSLSDGSDEVTKENLKIVTYNMWCNYLIKNKQQNFLNYVGRFESLVNGLKDVDVVFVQEIFIFRAGQFEFSNCVGEMVDIMQSKGFKYNTNVTDTVPYVFGQSSGVAIFSKIPLRSGHSEIFKNAGILEFVNNKGFASAEIIVNEKRISLFTVHTDAHRKVFEAFN